MGTKVGNVFVQGGIAPEFIADSIAKHSSKLQIGAHQIFLGQVRADAIDGKTVTAIEYTAYESMANQKFQEIKEAAFSKFDLVCMHCHHSLGRVEAGEVCLFVFVSSPHRKSAFAALEFTVEQIKAQLPVFGKELLGEDSHQWKTNT